MEQERLYVGALEDALTVRARTRGAETGRKVAVVPERRPVRRKGVDHVFKAVHVHADEPGGPRPSVRAAGGAVWVPHEGAAVPPDRARDTPTIGESVGGTRERRLAAFRAIGDVVGIRGRRTGPHREGEKVYEECGRIDPRLATFRAYRPKVGMGDERDGGGVRRVRAGEGKAR